MLAAGFSLADRRHQVSAAEPARDVNSLGLHATYEVDATFDIETRGVTVSTTAVVHGSVPWPTAELAFNLSTLRTGRASLTATSVNGRDVTAAVADQTVLVPLDPPLVRGESRTVIIDYRARLNANPDPESDEWGFAVTDTYLTSYRWIPWLTRTTPFDRPSVGDPFVTASSPLVEVEIVADPRLKFAAPGVVIERTGDVRHYQARNVRDFNVSASASYRTASRDVDGIVVTFLHRRLPPERVLDVAERTIRSVNERVGRYPYDQLTIAEIGPWAALESPMLFWLPENAPTSLLPWMTAHETVHQWFYAAVGNDQAREPFADEALTDFIARDVISRFVTSECPPGSLDASIYDLGDCYPWVIYVQGDGWLLDYRARVGSNRFWRGVSDYYEAYRFGMGGTRQLLDALGRAAGRTEVHRRFPSLYAAATACLPLGGRVP
jgi:hypothetical protein